MNYAKLLFLASVVVVWILLTAVTARNNNNNASHSPGCLHLSDCNNEDFKIRNPKGRPMPMMIVCLGDQQLCDKNPEKYCRTDKGSYYIDCSYSRNLSLIDTFRTMNISHINEIHFENVRSPSSRKYFQNVSVSKLTFTKSHMDELPFDVLYEVLDLRNLTIADSSLTRIPANFFNDWPRKLVDLDITYTNLEKITKDDFAHLTNLVHLKLYANKIADIEAGAFDSLSNLMHLILANNQLHILPSGIFRRLATLRILNLSQNPLDKLPSDLLTGIDNCQLDTVRMNLLSGSTLKTLPHGFFKNLTDLSNVELQGNQLESLPPDLFDETSKLKKLNLKNNSLQTLPPGLLKSCTKLQDLDLARNHIVTLPAGIFENLRHLESLNLTENHIVTLAAEVFENLRQLKKLDLAKNDIATLPAGISKNLGELRELDICYNNLTTLSSVALRGLISVKIFKACHNKLMKVDDTLCKSLVAVQTIDFSFNRLTFKASRQKSLEFDNPSIFMDCKEERLTNINLSNNKATEIFDDYRDREYIDLRSNNISELTAKDISYLRYKGTLDLRDNPITTINVTGLATVVAEYKAKNNTLSRRNLIIILGGNRLHCDCHLLDFIRLRNKSDERNHEYAQFVKLTTIIDGRSEAAVDGRFINDGLTCSSPAEFKGRCINSINPNELSCPLKTIAPNGDACSVNTTAACNCREYPHDSILSVDCSGKHLTRVPPIISSAHDYRSIELNLSHNAFDRTPSLDATKSPAYLTNVSSLDLSDNSISDVTFDLFQSKNLKHLYLHGNDISRIDQQTLKYLTSGNNSLLNMTLHRNPWLCDCKARTILNFVHTMDRRYKLSEVACAGTNNKLSELTLAEICPQDDNSRKSYMGLVVAASLLVAFFAIVIGLSAALYYKHQREIKVWLYSKQWCLWFVTEDELDKDKKYDAFVSFSHKDEEFVEKEIVAKLEGGPMPYKLCLHYRDWLAGEWIPDQIRQSVENSRRTIVVLSPDFLESVWARMEFRTAHTQALKEGRTRVIIIIYGQVEKCMDDLDPELKAYLRLHTYVKWGDPWFWDKLKYALPHNNRASLNNKTACNSDTVVMSRLIANESEKLITDLAS